MSILDRMQARALALTAVGNAIRAALRGEHDTAELYLAEARAWATVFHGKAARA